jgi:phage replication-related protein YjqB (UPF0714/DUF867 family)
MATVPVSVRKALSTQHDLMQRAEHCSIDARILHIAGLGAGQQVRIKRDATDYALFTAAEIRNEHADNVVRMGLAGRRRLDSGDPFAAELDSRAVSPGLSDGEAKRRGEFVERLDDNGYQARLVLIAPHGGEIEIRTDDQVGRVASCLADTPVSSWLCKGYHPGGASRAWHITSSDINPSSFPLLNSVFGRGFNHALAFHGFDRNEILIGGTASRALKRALRSAIRQAVDGSHIPVRIASPADVFGGDDPDNIVNRLTAGGHGGIQIEQSLAARTGHWAAIAEAVAQIYRADALPI